MKNIEKIIEQSDDKKYEKVDWTKTWSKKYPVLASYQSEVDIEKYAKEIRWMLQDLEETYKYSKQDAMLVLKDILAHEYLNNK
ncbi:MAG: hypothetical protein Q4B60_08795 [Erysipelotrichaceae bacterium]|nr:hypothetical protein [Erysipelotrichaceae bacterium]